MSLDDTFSAHVLENKALVSEVVGARRVVETAPGEEKPSFRIGAAQPDSVGVAPPDKIRPVGRLDPISG